VFDDEAVIFSEHVSIADARSGYTLSVRRLFSRLGMYFGRKDDGSAAPPPERITPWTVFAIFTAAMIMGAGIDAAEALLDGSEFDLADAAWHGAILGVGLLIVRIVEYQLHVRSKSRFRRRPLGRLVISLAGRRIPPRGDGALDPGS
jgi:heme/copper-type cytochrome/quinol oxidase subunit 3